MSRARLDPAKLSATLAEFRDHLLQRFLVERAQQGRGRPALRSVQGPSLPPALAARLNFALEGREPGFTLDPGISAELLALAAQMPDPEPVFLPPRKVRVQTAFGQAGALAAAARDRDSGPVGEALDDFLSEKGITLSEDERLLAGEAALRAAGEAWLGVAAHEEQIGRGWAAPGAAGTPVDLAGSANGASGSGALLPAQPAAPHALPEPRSGAREAHTTATATAGGASNDPVFVHELVARWGESRTSAAPDAAEDDEVRVSTASGRACVARLFLELMGPVVANEFTEQSAREFKRRLQRVPTMHGRGKEFRHLSVNEAIAKADALDASRSPEERTPRLSRATINSHLSAMTPALDGHAPRNLKGELPTLAVRFSKKQVEAQQTFVRKQYDDRELRAFFSGSIYTGHDGSANRTAPGPYVTRDLMYWVPLLALFQGLCLEEALQLCTKHVRTVDGVAQIEIGDGMVLKTFTRPRTLPVHPALIELGFVDWVDSVREAGGTRLFPEAVQAGPDKRYGHKETQRFTTYRRAVGITRKGVDFHALRTTFSASLKNSRQNQVVIGDMMGHARSGVTAKHYGGETPMPVMVEALEALTFKAVDLARLKKCAEQAEQRNGEVAGRLESLTSDRRLGRRSNGRKRQAPHPRA
ncbi:site-specific integrase [Sabulicella rubraurantiaca]|uniref:site-specific integrase n=1 Tax=Sabulicella rubraurantiaca TaxID=2811429 RepID=UPI001A9757F7|nr:site-specific integrase [Sabulicella rubraurantiaca]